MGLGLGIFFFLWRCWIGGDSGDEEASRLQAALCLDLHAFSSVEVWTLSIST